MNKETNKLNSDVLEYFQCECHSPEHHFIFSDMCDINDSYEDSGPWLHIYLKTDVWYKRIFIALKYIFGYKSKYGHFDEIILKQNDLEKLKNLLNQKK